MNFWASRLLSRILAAAPRRPLVVRYGTPILLVGLSLVLTFGFTDAARAPYFPLLVIAIALSAIVGGFGPGLFATSIAVPLGFYAFVQPRFTWGATYPEDLTRAALVLPAGLLISWLIGGFITSQEELQRSEEQFHLLAVSVPVGIFQTDTHGLWTYANPTCGAILGIVSYEARGNEWAKMIHPDDRNQVISEWSAAVKEGKRWSGEYRLLAAPADVPGEVRWVRELATPAVADGTFIGYVGMITDITDIKVAHLILADSEARFRQLADAIPQMIWTAKPDGEVDYYNNKWYERTELVPGQYGDDSWGRLLHLDDVERCKAQWSQAVRSGEPYEIEYRFADKNGRYRWHLGRGTPVRDETAKIVKWIGTCTDIEDMKRTQSSLLRAEKLAAAGKLAASIAHELNTPLGAVLNLVYLVRHEENPYLKGKYLTEAERELERVSRLANRCLSIYRGGTSKMDVKLDELIDEVIKIFHDSAVSRGITINNRTERNLTVFGSPDDLRHVIVNLVSNAIDALSENGTLAISARYSRDPKTAQPCIRLTVADDGSGISVGARKLLFDPFFTTKGETGAGLGLWIARSIVEHHMGTIHIRTSVSATRHGTAVSVSLPVAGASEAGSRIGAAARSGGFPD